MDNSENFASKKLQQANETIAKYGFPEELANKRALTGEKLNFWTSGIVVQADAQKNTFSVTVQSENKQTENTYIISTTAEILKSIVKEYWSGTIDVFLKPKAIIGQPYYYDLLEIR